MVSVSFFYLHHVFHQAVNVHGDLGVQVLIVSSSLRGGGGARCLVWSRHEGMATRTERERCALEGERGGQFSHMAIREKELLRCKLMLLVPPARKQWSSSQNL